MQENTSYNKKRLKSIVRILIIVIAGLVVLFVLMTVYDMWHELMFRSEMNGLIGYHQDDVLKMRGNRRYGNIYMRVLTNQEEIKIRQKYTGYATKILPRGKVILAKHSGLNLYSALIYLDEQNLVYAVQVGGEEYHEIEKELKQKHITIPIEDASEAN